MKLINSYIVFIGSLIITNLHIAQQMSVNPVNYIDIFNSASEDLAISVIRDISTSKKFQSMVVNGRPYINIDDLFYKLNIKINFFNFNFFL